MIWVGRITMPASALYFYWLVFYFVLFPHPEAQVQADRLHLGIPFFAFFAIGASLLSYMFWRRWKT